MVDDGKTDRGDDEVTSRSNPKPTVAKNDIRDTIL